jgi:UMF1 family MFS transporter
MGREENLLKSLFSTSLTRPEHRSWAMYDWANSAFQATVIAAVFPIYYAKVAASGLAPDVAAFRFGIATTIALVLVALASPLLGALADVSGNKKRLLAIFTLVGAASTAALAFVGDGDWQLALGLFMVGNIGAYGALAFYDSLLPHIATGEELDRVSTAGYAMGYLGSGLLLLVNLLWIQKPEWFGLADSGVGARLSFVSVGVWWAAFTLPLMRGVPEPPVPVSARSAGRAMAEAFGRLRGTLGDLRRYRHAFLMLLAFLLYNDGIGTMIRMASLYGTQVGIDQGSLIAALLMVQFVGIPFAILFGKLAARIGPKNAILGSLVVYTITAVLAFAMTTATHFFILAFLVGTVQGGSQALSRSLFASLIPKWQSSEFFGFFSVFEKFAGIFGPLIFSLAIALTGSSRAAILSVILFFVAGGTVLLRVDVVAGQRTIREEESSRASAIS